MAQEKEYVIGIDYGTDSVRSVLVDTAGNIKEEAVSYYKRWSDGKYIDSSRNMFRQHPKDYLEGLETTIKEILEDASDDVIQNIKAISIDTTGSTPAALDRTGTPLALTEGFEENPNAMFILWKDHTSVKEADEINELSRSWGGVDYTKYVGSIYSSEWFWAKILHTLREDKAVREAAYSWAEHCDWIPFELTGGTDVHEMKRSRCAAGHKAMWHKEFNGLPSEEFLTKLDPLLADLRDRLYRHTYTSDQSAGTLSKKWAETLGMPEDVQVGVGAFDAHMGAVGGEIEPYHLSKVMGTSTCDILVAPEEEAGDKLVKGICGQVDGSVVPGMLGLEAGQSAFGDVYAWFKDLLMWPVEHVIGKSDIITDEQKEQLINEAADRVIRELTDQASQLQGEDTGVMALDWLNGRRTPDANQLLKGAIWGLDLSSDAPKIFKALVEATCFGAKLIVDRFEDEGIPIKGIIGLGGVAKKSPFVMQTLADVLDMPIKIAKTEQTVALGAAMFAATVAGVFEHVEDAKEAMGGGFDKVYEPIPEQAALYKKLYERYKEMGDAVEELIMNKHEFQTKEITDE